VGWLWAERLSVDTLGVTENALRLVPLLASLVAVLAFPLLAQWTVGRWATPAATLLFATSPALIYYATETKQYSSDVTCVLLTLLITAALLRKRPSVRSAVLWGVACSVLSWCAFPAIVVAAMCGLLLAVRWVRNIHMLLVLAAGGVILLVNIIWQYIVTLHTLSQNGLLDGYWQAIGGYPGRPATIASDVSWLHRAGFGVLKDPGHLMLPWLVIAAATWGVVVIARRQVEAAVLLCLPLIAAVGLALAHRYPMSMRLSLFVLPSVLLLVSAGAVGLVTSVASLFSRSRSMLAVSVTLAAAVLVLATGHTTATGLGKLVHPDEVTAGREAVQFIVQQRQAGDVVLVESPWGQANQNFYGRRNGLRTNGSIQMASTGCKTDPVNALKGRKRVWLLFAHRASSVPANRSQVYVSHFPGATVTKSYEGFGGAGAYLLDFNEPPAQPVAPLPTWAPGECVTVALAG
jgi:hypothetical protein